MIQDENHTDISSENVRISKGTTEKRQSNHLSVLTVF